MTWRLLAGGLLVLVLAGCQPGGSGAGDTASAERLSVLTGQVRYQDRVYGSNGFVTGNTPWKPARSVQVDVLNADGDRVYTTWTDGQGDFVWSQPPAGDYTVQVLARAEGPRGEIIEVRNLSEALFAAGQTVTLTEPDTDLTLDMTLSSRMAGVFNSLDVMLTGFEFFDTWSPDADPLNDLDLYWQYGDSAGTFTCLGSGGGCTLGSGIYVLSDPYQTGDTDAFDDDVLWHELAHHIEFSRQLTDSPGGAHSLLDTDLDLRLSWSEGWANYFQTAIKSWLAQAHPTRLSTAPSLPTSYYIDTRSSYAAISLDLATLGDAFHYATNEGAVAKVMLGVQGDSGLGPVFRPIINDLPFADHARTLEAYWDALQASTKDTTKPIQWQSHFNDRSIYYRVDGLEQDATAATAPTRACDYADQTLPHTCVDGEWRTLYSGGAPDRDVIALDLSADVHYRVRTHDLRNGADTRLWLETVDGTLWQDRDGQTVSNDDASDCETDPGGCSPLHDGDHFSSQLDFVSATDTRVYLVVAPATAAWDNPIDYGYLARYGDYALSVELRALDPPP